MGPVGRSEAGTTLARVNTKTGHRSVTLVTLQATRRASDAKGQANAAEPAISRRAGTRRAAAQGARARNRAKATRPAPVRLEAVRDRRLRAPHMARGNPTPPSRQGTHPRRAKRPGALRADESGSRGLRRFRGEARCKRPSEPATRPGGHSTRVRLTADRRASAPVRGDRADGGSGAWTRPRAAVDKRSRSALPSARGQHVTHRGFPGLRGPGFVGRSSSTARARRDAGRFPGFAARASLESR